MGLLANRAKRAPAQRQLAAAEKLASTLATPDVEAIASALAEAQEASCTDAELLQRAIDCMRALQSERIEAAQRASIAAATDELMQLVVAATADAASESSLDALESAILDADAQGVPKQTIGTAASELQRARTQRQEDRLRRAIANGSEAALQAAVQAARASKKRSSANNGGWRWDAALLARAEEALKLARRASAARNHLRRTADMSGPAALERAIAQAKGDQYCPPDEIMRAERMLRQRRKEQRILRWLTVLRAARQSMIIGERREHWHMEMVAGTGGSAATQMELLTSLGELKLEVARRRANPHIQPPAWLHLVTEALERFPSPALTPSQLARAKASVRRAASSKLSRTALRALQEMLRTFHPDKNGSFGPTWLAVVEELTKLAVELYSECQARIADQPGLYSA